MTEHFNELKIGPTPAATWKKKTENGVQDDTGLMRFIASTFWSNYNCSHEFGNISSVIKEVFLIFLKGVDNAV